MPDRLREPRPIGLHCYFYAEALLVCTACGIRRKFRSRSEGSEVARRHANWHALHRRGWRVIRGGAT